MVFRSPLLGVSVILTLLVGEAVAESGAGLDCAYDVDMFRTAVPLRAVSGAAHGGSDSGWPSPGVTVVVVVVVQCANDSVCTMNL